MGGSSARSRAGLWVALAAVSLWTRCSPREPASNPDAPHQPPDASLDPGTLDEERRVVASVVAPVLAETPRRAIGVLLTDARGPRFYLFGARSRDGAPFDPDTTFEIGSVSKVFAGVLLADAERRGEVGLDEPIAKYLPDWSLPSRDGQRMTLRHAATHFTGLPLMPSNWVKTAGGTTRYTEALFRDHLASHALASAPGERYVYGNPNTALLGLALTRRTGLAYSRLLRERIFEPLAMRRSGYPDLQPRLDANSLDGYEEDETLSVPRIDVSPMGPCCVVRSTLRDLSRFAAAALDRAGPLGPAFARAAEPQRAIDPKNPDSRWIALGWEVEPRQETWRKSGQVSGYRCELVLQPRKRRGLFVLVNSMRANILGLSGGLVRGLWEPTARRDAAAP